MRRFLDAERGCRLVQDQHAGAKMDGAGNGQRLALAARQAADKPVAIVDAGNAKVLHRLDGNVVGAPVVEAFERSPALGRLFAHEERASDAHQRERAAKLVDGGNAIVAGIPRAAESDGLAAHLDRAGRRLVDAGQYLDERRLAGAVVAKQAQDFTSLHLH